MVKNIITIKNGYAEMIVTNKRFGKVKTFIDIEDVEKVKQYKWYVHESKKKGCKSKLYIKAIVNGTSLYLHRFLIDDETSMEIDHIDGDSLNNRKSNLRLVSRLENSVNLKARHTNKSGVKNVRWRTEKNRWYVEVKFNSEERRKMFKNFNEAVGWRNKQLYELHGVHANYGDSYIIYIANEEEMKQLVEDGFMYIGVRKDGFEFLLTDELKAYVGYTEE